MCIRDSPEVLAQLQGLPDTALTLRLETASGAREVRLTRSLLPARDLVVARLARGQLYVHVPTFSPGVAQRVARVVRETRPPGVVLDMRHNGGGYVPEGVALADVFLSGGVIAGVRSGPGRPGEVFSAVDEPGDYDGPLAVLVDIGSASATELVTLALRERARAVVLGTETAGKGSIQRLIHLPDGGVLKVTAGNYVGPSGTKIDEGGISPDRFLAPPRAPTVLEGASPEEDPWVLAALDALRGPREPPPPPWGPGPSP